MPDVEGGGYFGSAVRAASEGLSAGAWIRALQEAGTGIRRQVALRIFAEAKVVAAEAGAEPARDVTAVPELSQMPPIPTRSEQGVLQTVRLLYRERVTGNIRQVFYNVKSEAGIPREEAISQAISSYQQHAEDYEQDLVGAVHSSAVRLTPVTVTG